MQIDAGEEGEKAMEGILKAQQSDTQRRPTLLKNKNPSKRYTYI